MIRYDIKKMGFKESLPKRINIDKAAFKFIIACFASDWLDCKPFGRFSRLFNTNANTMQLTMTMRAIGIRKA